MISYGDAIRKLAESLSYFVTRDVLYVVGGSSVILSFLYLFDRLPGSDLPTVWYVLGAGIAYVIGYAIQDGLSLTPITTTQSVIHPNRVVKKLYEWFAGPPWKDIPDHDHELATILVTEQAGERTIAELRRIISIKQIGTTMGSCWLVGGLALTARCVLKTSGYGIFLAVATIVFAALLLALGWVKGAQQAQRVYRLYDALTPESSNDGSPHSSGEVSRAQVD